MIVTRVEKAGFAGWYWVTLADLARHSVTQTELAARVSNGEWIMPNTLRIEEYRR